MIDEAEAYGSQAIDIYTKAIQVLLRLTAKSRQFARDLGNVSL
jgi:hypothetical protein